MYRHINEVLLGDEAAADRSTAAPVDASEAAPPGMMALNSVEPLLFIVVAPRSVDFKIDQSFSPRFILGKVSQSAGRSVCHERTAAASPWICFQAAVSICCAGADRLGAVSPRVHAWVSAPEDRIVDLSEHYCRVLPGQQGSEAAMVLGRRTRRGVQAGVDRGIPRRPKPSRQLGRAVAPFSFLRPPKLPPPQQQRRCNGSACSKK